jgi:hypothetical protein
MTLDELIRRTKDYRNRTGCTLREAKRAVEDGIDVDAAPPPAGETPSETRSPAAYTAPERQGETAGDEELVRLYGAATRLVVLSKPGELAAALDGEAQREAALLSRLGELRDASEGHREAHAYWHGEWRELLVRAEAAEKRAEEALKALAHMEWCATCAEGSWDECDDGREAKALLSRGSGTNSSEEG